MCAARFKGKLHNAPVGIPSAPSDSIPSFTLLALITLVIPNADLEFGSKSNWKNADRELQMKYK